jgi:hypothetical protein
MTCCEGELLFSCCVVLETSLVRFTKEKQSSTLTVASRQHAEEKMTTHPYLLK